jgi:hypothetical protein
MNTKVSESPVKKPRQGHLAEPAAAPTAAADANSVSVRPPKRATAAPAAASAPTIVETWERVSATAQWQRWSACWCAEPEILRRLTDSFDLVIGLEGPAAPAWLALPPGWTLFARDCLDGAYLQHRQHGHVLYVSREGAAGCVAGSLDEWLHTLIALPSWRDLLAYSDQGDPLTMRRLATQLAERDLQELPNLAKDRAYLQSALTLDEARWSQAGPYAEPVGRLYHAALRLPVPPVTVEGRRCRALFGERRPDQLV